MVETTMSIDWTAWLRRWDRMQTGYLPDREERFRAMLDALEILLPTEFVAVDLACGPGAISQRLLMRFERAHVVAVDLDPVLLAIGQNALGTVGGRLRWMDADLREDNWIHQVGETQVDAVLSTTALHWLNSADLSHLYHQLGELIHPGGVFLNGDHLHFPSEMELFRRAVDQLRARRDAEAFDRQGIENWEQWWDALKHEPGLSDLFAERERRFAWRATKEGTPNYDAHVRFLHDAGFREVDTLWQQLDNRVVMAVR